MGGDFPGGPGVRTLPFNAGGAVSIPDQKAKILHGSWTKMQNITQKYISSANNIFFCQRIAYFLKE